MKAVREVIITYKRSLIKLIDNSHQNPWRPEGSGITFLKCIKKERKKENNLLKKFISSILAFKKEKEIKTFLCN